MKIGTLRDKEMKVKRIRIGAARVRKTRVRGTRIGAAKIRQIRDRGTKIGAARVEKTKQQKRQETIIEMTRVRATRETEGQDFGSGAENCKKSKAESC